MTTFEASVYETYLEIGPSGMCMAHVPSLPGCMVRADSLEQALAALPVVIRRYLHWLRLHEPGTVIPDEIAVKVVETVSDIGPFDPSDAAALFVTDRQALSREALEQYLQYASYGRRDLLALTEPLPDLILDWQPTPQQMSIRHILRHIGNAEEWYVSRLVPPETLPPEWEDDAALPIFAFLEMERRTVAEQLRLLTAEERAAVFTPSHYTEHHDERWTARKALRRLVEHQLEHTQQIREVLAGWRRLLLAELALQRAALFEQFLDLDEGTLVGQPVFEGHTAKDLLAHIGAWDDLYQRRIALVLDGNMEQLVSVELDERNARLRERHAGWTLEQALHAFLEARAALLQTLSGASEEQLHLPLILPWSDSVPMRRWIEWRARHDAEHADDLRQWRDKAGLERGIGPLSLLLAAFQTNHEAFLALGALVPEAERESRPLEGEWSLKDLVGHVADWEAYAVECLRSGKAPEGTDDDMDRWNEAHVAMRRKQSWQQVWHDFQQNRQMLSDVLMGVSPAQLEAEIEDPWGRYSVYQFSRIFAVHELEHAQTLAEQLLPNVYTFR